MKKYLLLICVLVPLLMLTLLIRYGNKRITVTEYTVQNSEIPESFDGYVIAQVSDLHNAVFGKGNSRLLSALSETSPDCIVVTGDVIDSRRTNTDAAAEFLAEAVKIAPVFYCTGNHESRIPDEFMELLYAMDEIGVTVLRNESLLLAENGDTIRLVGLEDPAFYDTEEETLRALRTLAASRQYTIVLSHRPEFFEDYCATEADLVLTGHAHGGQFRIPGLGGVYVPDQGFFPKYDEGMHTQNGTTMIVSRGLGNSLFPFRLGNPPEIVTVTLQR